MAVRNDIIVNMILKADQFARGLQQPVTSLGAMQRAFERITQGQLTLRQVTIAGRQEWQIYDNVNKQFVDTQTKMDFAIDAVTQAIGQQVTTLENAARVTNRLDRALGAVGAESTKMAQLTGSANFAVLSLGQAFQDSAQFGMGFAQGMRAITNNIQQTAQAMIFMATQAKAMGLSMRTALTASIMGPGGALLAMGAITAAIEFFSARSMGAKKDIEEMEDAFSSLFTVLKSGDSVTLASADRARRLAEGYKALADEQGRAERAGTSFVASGTAAPPAKIMTESAIAAKEARIQAEGYADSLNKVYEEAKLNEDALAARARQLGVNGLRVEELTSKGAELAAQLRDLLIPLSDEAQALENGNRALKDRIDALTEIRRLQDDLIATTASRMSSVAASLEGVFEGVIDLPEGELDLGDRLLTLSDLTKRTAEDMRDLSLSVEEVFLLGAELGDGDLTLGSALETDADRVEDALKRINASVNTQLTNISVSWATGVADLITGAQKSPIIAVLDPFADMAINLGKVAVSTGIAMLGIKKAFESLNPATAIAAGTALIVLGKVVKNKIKEAGAPVTGSGGSSSGFSGVGAAPTFFTGFTNTSQIPASSLGFPVVPLGQRSQQQVNFVIDGRNLVGVLENNSAAQQRMTGRSMVVGTARPSSGGGFVDLTLER